MLISNKRTAGLPSTDPIGPQSSCSAPLGSLHLGLCRATAPSQINAPLGSLPLGPCWASAPHQIHTLLGSLPLGLPTTQTLPDPISVRNDQSHAPLGSPPLRHCQIPTPPESLPFRQSQATALQAFQITAPSGYCSGHH
jgi:hypothetical protein